jgi:hypothetical protein
MMVLEFGSTGAEEMSVFHGLMLVNGRNPLRAAPWPVPMTLQARLGLEPPVVPPVPTLLRVARYGLRLRRRLGLERILVRRGEMAMGRGACFLTLAIFAGLTMEWKGPGGWGCACGTCTGGPRGGGEGRWGRRLRGCASLRSAARSKAPVPTCACSTLARCHTRHSHSALGYFACTRVLAAPMLS